MGSKGNVLGELEVDMLVPRGVVQQVLVVGGLLEGGGAQAVALGPGLGHLGVLADEALDARGLAVAGPRDGVHEHGEGDRARGDVEGGLYIVMSATDSNNGLSLGDEERRTPMGSSLPAAWEWSWGPWPEA